MAPSKQKYAHSDITGIITGEEAEAASLSSKPSEEKEVGSVELMLEEEGDIEVSIDRSAKTLHGARASREHRSLNAEDAAMGGPSEVVIHSGESDSGFATLNPIISSSAQRRLPNHGAFVAPGMTKSSGVPVAKASPVLLEIPAAEQANTGRDRLLLIINALGATGLPKAEKFGTQSCLLEMRLFDSSNVYDSDSPGTWSSYLMRTELHKKGGSEAQWNQQFTTTLRSKETQFLHVEVKTSSKILVGEANVSLDKVGDLFYDQHYPLFRNDESSDNDNEPVLLSAGQVHLQLKIVDAGITPTTVVPPLQLPGFSKPQTTQSTIKRPISAKSIPAVLLNGGLFFKVPYHTHNMVGRSTGPRRQWVAVRRATDPPHLQITWGDPTLSGSAEKKNLRSLDLALVTEIREGHTTAAFAAQTESNVVKETEKCFSLVMRARTLDLVAASKEEAQIWINSLRELLFASEPLMDSSLLSARMIESFKQSALSSRGDDGNTSGKPTASAPTKRMIAAWRNRIFNLARNDRLGDILECLEDGCPIDLLEGGSDSDALTRKQRAHSLSPRGYTPEWAGTSHYSARELPAYSPFNERLVATERLDRDHIRPYHQYATRENDPRYCSSQSWDHYHQESGYSHHYGMHTQRQAAPENTQSLQTRWSEARPISSAPPATSRSTWNQYSQVNTNLYSQHVPHVQTESQWDTHYTEDGYPYYVNKTTGVSQWEKPVEENANRISVAQEMHPDSRHQDTLSPDAIIRLRLAEVRKQKSQTALVSPVSSPATSCSTPTLTSQPTNNQRLASELYASNPELPSREVQVVPTCVMQSDTFSEPSKYEDRTGLKLSVDIAAPPAQNASGSFEKSRASSPRGRSKNIQLIELKRANNLALALASFKIHDHYEQIVNDIVTMDERVVNPALLGCLQRFFPTVKEKQALQNFNGSVSTLGKAERFFCLLFQVPGMQERIDMFLYKMEFGRTRSALLSRILVVKRGCRDLVENYSFIEALEQFFKKQKATSFAVFEDNKAMFISGYLSEVDEKLKSFRGDLEKAMCVELVELQLQLNRLVAGMRPIQSFVNRSPSSRSAQSEERDSKARDILQRFLADTRTQLAEIESEFEAMELWGDKLLTVFGESKATCQISAILRVVVELL
ncbi:Major Facilitator Superfamily (MFS) [Phytophthora nicotianae]|uniref:Major Facilitator Superfamily (MFS) n=1 Tax=Phytophthora nicotianae TaxID=4792 RepID=A0A0W8D494_PHYNI|nr:Major Facilitator Superfamily (MFS) [Phytophthora nicotianae]